ncbi:hypothetical protein DsansV1_C01g0003001 [Dioscorea sansibarensis]
MAWHSIAAWRGHHWGFAGQLTPPVPPMKQGLSMGQPESGMTIYHNPFYPDKIPSI